MEPRFGHDFSRVRVHTDSRAAESALAVNALAYTVGRDVVFGTGQHAPHTRAGQKLLAHELTHAVQQGETAHAQRHDATIGPAQDAYESEAERVAQLISVRRNAAPIERLTAQPALQRQPAPPKDDAKKKPGEKEVITQPPPQKIPVPQARKEDKAPAKPESKEEKKGVEKAVSVGVETETKREEEKTTTERAGKFSFEVEIPITDKLQLGPVSFLKGASAEASGGLKSGKSGPTSLELETTVKVISLDFEKVKIPLGIADFGISGSALAGAEYSPVKETGAAKIGFAGEAEAKFKRSEESPFFITVKGGVEKTYDKEGNADFKWSPLTWKTGAAVGVEF
ncbi:MAG: eCIS core domain-containing protein [Methylococcales bacterium]